MNYADYSSYYSLYRMQYHTGSALYTPKRSQVIKRKVRSSKKKARQKK